MELRSLLNYQLGLAQILANYTAGANATLSNTKKCLQELVDKGIEGGNSLYPQVIDLLEEQLSGDNVLTTENIEKYHFEALSLLAVDGQPPSV